MPSNYHVAIHVHYSISCYPGTKALAQRITKYHSQAFLRLRDLVCLWCSIAHAHGRFSMDFELTPLVLSSIFSLEPKIAFNVYGSEET